jgi:hypothetical protein
VPEVLAAHRTKHLLRLEAPATARGERGVRVEGGRVWRCRSGLGVRGRRKRTVQHAGDTAAGACRPSNQPRSNLLPLGVQWAPGTQSAGCEAPADAISGRTSGQRCPRSGCSCCPSSPATPRR